MRIAGLDGSAATALPHPGPGAPARLARVLAVASNMVTTAGSLRESTGAGDPSRRART